MSTVKKTLALLNILVLFLLLFTGVYAWLSFDRDQGDLDGDVERDIFLSSSMLFDGFYTATLYNTSNSMDARYNTVSSEFQEEGDLSLTFRRSDLNQHVNSQGVLRLEITAYIKALSDIKPRFKVIQKWKNTSGATIENQGLVTTNYGDDIDVLSGKEFVYYNSIIEKSDEYVPITLVKSFNISNRTTFNNNEYLSISLILSVMQANRSSAFSEEAGIFKETVTFNNNYNMNDFVVDRSELSTFNSTLRNTVIKFKRYHSNGKLNDSGGNYDEYIYINHPRANKDNFTIQAGTYEMIIYSLNQISIDLNNTTNPTKATFYYTYNEDSWGIEDYIYGSKPVMHNISGYGFASGELVYYEGLFYVRVQNGSYNYTPGPNAPWSLYNAMYRSGATYFTGDKVFYGGAFWEVVNDWVTSFPESGKWGWSSYEGGGFSPSMSYNVNSFTWDNNNKSANADLSDISWYHGTAHGNTYGYFANNTSWKTIGYEYSPIDGGVKNEVGEIVLYNDEWYIVNESNVWLNENNPSNSSSFTKAVKRGEYNESTTYTQGNIVEVIENGKVVEYLWYKPGNAPIGVAPRTEGSAGWRDLSAEWNPYDLYRYTNYIRETVTYNGKTYIWNGSDNSNSNEAPGEAFNNWIELTTNWAPFNNYKKNDFVIYDGTFWRAKLNDLIDPLTGANMIPRAKGSYEYWEEWPVVFTPGRD